MRAKSAHEMLAAGMRTAPHSLAAAVREASAGGLLETNLRQRLRRLAQAADVCRHLTLHSVDLLLKDLAASLAAGPVTDARSEACGTDTDGKKDCQSHGSEESEPEMEDTGPLRAHEDCGDPPPKSDAVPSARKKNQ